MSREVDQRVVEMQFNNADFEKNTRKSIQSIDRLMEKLQFKGAEKGFEKLDAAAEKVDFDTMARSLDGLESKFSALNIIATTALVNITNKVVDAGEKMVKSLSLDQVASGWDKYVSKTGNVQTIMNATGKSIDQVNGYLNKLMWYSDETSFSFDEMTSAISQMTASGGDIEKMVTMVMGIANATADAGKSGFAFQSTIRNLTQSYSAGYLQLMDWRSLNLMGTATKALKQELIDTAVELGTLKEGEVTVASFEDTLSKKWANTKVMEKTFEKYAAMMEDAYELTQKEHITSSEALERLSGQYGEIAERSALAAQQAKSFSEAIDSTKDAVSSKWMKTFELIFGNKEEAVDTWTELANRLYDIFVPPIEALNDRLSGGLNSGWQQLRDELGDSADAYEHALQKIALQTGAVTQEQIDDAGSFGKALQNGAVNADMLRAALVQGQRELDAMLQMSDAELDAKGWDRDVIQRQADSFAELNEELKAGTLNLGEFSKKIGELSGREHLMQSLWNIMDAIGKVVTPVKEAFDEIFPPASGDRIYSFAQRLDDLTGKLIISDAAAEKIKMTFKGVFSVVKVGTTALNKIGSVGVKAFGLVLNAAEPVGDVLLNIGAGLGTFVTRVQELLTSSEPLETKILGVKDALKKLLSPLEDLTSQLRNTKLGRTIDELLQKGEDADGILGSLYSTGKRAASGIAALVQGVAGGGITLLGALGMAAGALVSKLGTVGELAEGFLGHQLPTWEELGEKIGEMPQKLDANIAAFAAGFSSSMERITGSAEDAFAPVQNFFVALKEGFDAISGTDIYRFLSLVDVGLLAFAINSVAKAMVSLKKMLETPLTALLDAMTGSFKGLTSALKTWQKNESAKTLTSMATAVLILAGAMFVMSRIDPSRFTETVLATIGLIAALTTAAKLLTPEVKTFGKAMDGLKSQVLNAATLWGTAAALVGLGVAVKNITSGFTALMSVLKDGNFAENLLGLGAAVGGLALLIRMMGKLTATLVVGDKSISHKALLSTAVELVALASAVKVLAKAVEPLSEIPYTSLLKAGIAISGLITEVSVMTGALMVIQKISGPLSIQNGLAVAEMAGGIWIIAQAVSSLANIKLVKIDAAMTSMKTLMLLMTVMSVIASKTRFTSGAAVLAMASSMVVLAGAVELFALMGDGAIDGMVKVFTALTLLTAASSWSTGTASAGVGILGMAAALYVLAGAVEKFGRMDSTTLVQGGISAALGLTGFVAALKVLSTLDFGITLGAISKSMLTFSIALGVMGLALHAFDSVTLGQVGSGLLAFGGAIGIVCATAAAVGYFTPLAAGLGILAKAFDKFGAGALKLAGATAVFGVLSMFAGPICQAIVNAAPDIQDALIATVTLICNTIIACAEPIALALTALGTAALAAIVGILANVWVMIQPALEDLWGKFSAWVSSKFQQLPELLNPFGKGGDPFAGASEYVKNSKNSPLHWLDDILEELQNGDSLMAGIYQAFSGAGKNAAAGLAEGQQDTDAVQKVKDAAEENATVILDTTADTLDEHSPSKEMHEKGLYAALGLAEGLVDPDGLAAVRAAATTLARTIDTQFCDVMQIHSPSLLMKAHSLFIPLGAVEGITEGTALTADAISVMGNSMAQKIYDLDNPLYTAGSYAGAPAVEGFRASLQAGFEKLYNGGSQLWKNVISNNTSYGSLLADWEGLLKKSTDSIADAAGTTSKKGSSSKSKGKTLAETLADEYSKKLKANKYLQDALTKETTLWDLTSADMVTSEELLAKRTETAAKSIELQTDRVKIAQEQYDTLLKKVGKDNDKTKDAYATLLDEQASLEKLKQSRYDDIWEDVLKRYENDSKTAEDEYKLWAAVYEDTASVTEQANQKMAYIQKKINAQTELTASAEKEYTELKAEFGEQSQRTQEAYRKYLEEQKEQQDLINELEEAQLEQFDNQIARYEKEAKLVQNRQQMLAKIYNDGDLSSRGDAYTAAVEKYGEGSKEARTAAMQGTMTSLVSVGTAMTNMSTSLRKLTEYQKKYDAIADKSSDDALDAIADLQSEQYNLVGFAENLADAFDLSDNGKKAMMQLGYTISKNWKPIQNGFTKVWSRVQQQFPQTAEKLTRTLNLAMSEGAAEVASSFAQTIVAAMSGDYATALIAGLNTVLGFLNTEFGKAVLKGLGSVFAKAALSLKNGTGLLSALAKLFGSGSKLASVAQTTAQIAQTTGEVAETVGGSGGIAATLSRMGGSGGLLRKIASMTGKIGTVAKTGVLKVVTAIGGKVATLAGGSGLIAKIAGLLGSTGPVGIAIGAVAAGGAYVITHWEKVKMWFGKFGNWLKEKFSNLWSGTKSFFSGIWNVGKNIGSGLWNGIKSVGSTLWGGIKKIGSSIVNGFKSFFGIHSPSKVMFAIGGYIGEGLANGITDSSAGVDRSVEDMTHSALRIASEGAARMLDVAESDNEPVIRPLVDLTNVREGAAWVSENLTGDMRSVVLDLVRTNRLADAVTRFAEIQNGERFKQPDAKEKDASNRDVVEAIGTLGGRIDSVAAAVGRMKVTIDKRKFVGEVIDEVDERLGKRTKGK